MIREKDFKKIKNTLKSKGLKATQPRLAIGYYCLHSKEHPTAYQVEAFIKKHFPEISLASVYNTLNQFVKKGILKEVHIEKDTVRYDPMTVPQHHFYDVKTKKIYDIEWDQVKISQNKKLLKKFNIQQSQVLMKGVIAK